MFSEDHKLQKNCLPVKMFCIVYRVPSLDDVCQISDHLAKWFKRKRYLRMHSK
jgi:hypothetical protein